MSQWGSSDSGILRKNKVDDNLDQLLVFGYSCKIFRDDEKALYIDQGKHLIPWMGQETLKIDRYDGRAALPNLKSFEASREGFDNLRWLGLNLQEKKLEELCDKERYYSLEINEEEEEMYKEEAVKRQQTNAIAFDYNNPQPQEQGPQPQGIPTVPEKEEEDEPYTPSHGLDVPVDINLPKTVKEYARIEKTALFVCRQGLQMEILIKTKQASNPQFSFLTVQDPLYKFYRHVLSAFKNGRYQPQCDNKKTEEAAKDAQVQDEQQDSHYLHPSLQSSAGVGNGKPATPPITTTNQQNAPPAVPYRPTADCAYSQLVNRIQGAGLAGQPDAAAVQQQQQQEPAPNQMQIINQMNLEQQYHQYYYVQQFYEYWRHTVVNSEQGAMYAGLPLDFSQLDPNMQSYIHQLAWPQFVQHHQQQIQETQHQQAQVSANNNSYAQIVSNLNKDGANPYSANVPHLPPPVKEEVKVALTEEKVEEERTVALVKYESNEVTKPLMSLAAAYGSESESSSSESESERSKDKKSTDPLHVYRVPFGEMQTVIDKMAEYVAKNGAQFEQVIRQKADKRFEFLNDGHEFNKYYRVKLGELRGDSVPKITVDVKKATLATSPSKTKSSKKPIAPVSFSIKKPKEETTKEIKSALPMEDSSEEGDDNYLDQLVSTANSNSNGSLTPKEKSDQSGTKTPSLITPDRVEVKGNSESNSPRTPKKRSRTSSPKVRNASPAPPAAKTKRLSPAKERVKKATPVIDMFAVAEETKTTNGSLAKDDPILEMIELERQEVCLAEKRAEDAKEKARQLERKRKAAMFLKLKSVETKPIMISSSPEKSTTSIKPSTETKRNVSSEESGVAIRSRSKTREKDKRHCRSTKSRSPERRKESKKHKKSRDRSESDDRRRRKEKRKKRKRSKSKKKSKKHKRSRSRSRSRSYRSSKSRSRSVKSHISIDDSS